MTSNEPSCPLAVVVLAKPSGGVAKAAPAAAMIVAPSKTNHANFFLISNSFCWRRLWQRSDTIRQSDGRGPRAMRGIATAPSNAVLCGTRQRKLQSGSRARDSPPINEERTMGEPEKPSPEQPTERLDSWKEIATHFNRDVTTVQRWEKREGMPVHRHLHDRAGSIYAFTAE